MHSLTNGRTAKPNWVHLDLKGAIPSYSGMLEWLHWLAGAGFNGIVWEYEDRLPWRSWPGAFREGYTLPQWQEIWERCRTLNLAVVPLVPTHGHLEWLLSRDEYAAWCEDSHMSEVCPCQPGVLPAILGWLDEVMELHPASRLIHVGGDETWYLASCPACAAKAAASPLGKMAVYLDHVGAICRHVIAAGRRPMLWADAFWPEETRALVAQLPAETVLIDWQYGWLGPTSVTPA